MNYLQEPLEKHLRLWLPSINNKFYRKIMPRLLFDNVEKVSNDGEQRLFFGVSSFERGNRISYPMDSAEPYKEKQKDIFLCALPSV
jgi:hypothetical protein